MRIGSTEWWQGKQAPWMIIDLVRATNDIGYQIISLGLGSGTDETESMTRTKAVRARTRGAWRRKWRAPTKGNTAQRHSNKYTCRYTVISKTFFSPRRYRHEYSSHVVAQALKCRTVTHYCSSSIARSRGTYIYYLRNSGFFSLFFHV